MLKDSITYDNVACREPKLQTLPRHFSPMQLQNTIQSLYPINTQTQQIHNQVQLV